ncbi:MAG: recombinase RecX [Bacteroidetes bacterium SW_9_63_38]|nr:MAG: recombinase RecX [Bacteroidetes bacterium SW_9_63_38]
MMVDNETPDDAAPTITALEPQTHDDSRVSVFLDGEFVFGVHEDIVVKHELRTGMTLSPEKQRAVEHDEQYVEAKQTALNYLAHKPRTEEEVRRKLRKTEASSSVIEDVVERLHELSYLDDEAYAEDYVRNRFASKKYGPVRIRRELVERGVDRRVADDAVAALFADEDPVAAAREHAEKRWGRLSKEEDPRRRRQKLYRYLRRRGFRSDTINPILDDLERDAGRG